MYPIKMDEAINTINLNFNSVVPAMSSIVHKIELFSLQQLDRIDIHLKVSRTIKT